MGQPRKPYANRGPIQYTSISSALKFGDSDSNPPIPWIHVEAAGSGGLVVKTEDGTSRTYASLPAGKTLYGPFTEITSMTLGRIMIGDGPAPESTLNTVAPASAAALGSVEMSVAPASADTPIAVGTNDPRVTIREFAFALDGTDGSLTETALGTLGVAATLVSVELCMDAAVTQNDTNYDTITLAKRDGAGGSATTLVARNTKSTGGVALLAFQWVDLGSLSVAAVADTDVLTLKSVKSASGQASGAGLIRLTFTVP